MKSLTVLLLFALSVATYAETEFFNQGKNRWKIGISPDATAVEKYAAEELKNTLKKNLRSRFSRHCRRCKSDKRHHSDRNSGNSGFH